MRRQSKPFVTEYKSSPRRPKDSLDHESLLETAPASDSSRLDPFRAEAARMTGSDDGYDAAMRAADALFSPKPAATATTTGAGSKGEAATAPERHGGRILQAIEAAPVDRFAELEALHAPKRRGRKPGSKNKPKASVVLDSRPPHPAPTYAAPASARALHPTPAAPPLAAVTALPPVPAIIATRRGERFGWVRATLRPGERWKRRLPKVAW